jgi:hypothetical protein
MRTDKILAAELRKSGKSYSQISAVLKIPKGTLSLWLKDIKLSNNAQAKIQLRTKLAISKLIIRNKQKTVISEKRHAQIYKLGKKEAKKLLKDPLFLAGTSLYWAEGYKRGAEGSKWKSVDFANSDSQMIQIMILFFTKFLNLKKTEIKIQIMLHDKKMVEEAVNFWHNITGVPKTNFIKTCYSLSSASLQKQKKKLQYGTIHLRVNDVNRFFRLIGWIDGLKEKFNLRGVAQLV